MKPIKIITKRHKISKNESKVSKLRTYKTTQMTQMINKIRH